MHVKLEREWLYPRTSVSPHIAWPEPHYRSEATPSWRVFAHRSPLFYRPLGTKGLPTRQGRGYQRRAPETPVLLLSPPHCCHSTPSRQLGQGTDCYTTDNLTMETPIRLIFPREDTSVVRGTRPHPNLTIILWRSWHSPLIYYVIYLNYYSYLLIVALYIG